MTLFRRRKPRPIHRRIINVIWPLMGIKRTGHYVMHRLGRLRGGPYAIAAGFASGAAISFTPFMGFHLLLSAALAWATRGSIVASLIGTLIGNPWTFPFIWLWIYHLGVWMMGGEATAVLPEEGLSISILMDQFRGIFIPMVMGGLPTAIVVWWIFYWLGRRLMERYHLHRRNRSMSRQRKLAMRRADEMLQQKRSNAEARSVGSEVSEDR